ncbi:hypothetical protein OG943_15800 [Amycolatopsis sp. NBC_00345]|uniref:hypothetical protein n=1 Tax=Amycolatopsis sp. NBC_00345 TaxID=2975955 RepID=UPI002E26B0B8
MPGASALGQASPGEEPAEDEPPEEELPEEAPPGASEAGHPASSLVGEGAARGRRGRDGPGAAAEGSPVTRRIGPVSPVPPSG